MPYSEYDYNDELYHYGVVGMKWGHRKERELKSNIHKIGTGKLRRIYKKADRYSNKNQRRALKEENKFFKKNPENLKKSKELNAEWLKKYDKLYDSPKLGKIGEKLGVDAFEATEHIFKHPKKYPEYEKLIKDIKKLQRESASLTNVASSKKYWDAHRVTSRVSRKAFGEYSKRQEKKRLEFNNKRSKAKQKLKWFMLGSDGTKDYNDARKNGASRSEAYTIAEKNNEKRKALERKQFHKKLGGWIKNG